jgi:hypothetical protein
MIPFGRRPLKELLKLTIPEWDHSGTPQNVRDNFRKIINCGTPVLGAEVYRSATELKIVYHTCKSRFCPSCGARAASTWQEELEAVLPKVPYVEINFTMPKVIWPILEQNRHLLNDLPALGAAAIQFWAKATLGASIILMVVQQTYGGFLNFYPHLHMLVSAGGLVESSGQWISSLEFGKEQHKHELMLAWRFVLLAFLDDAIKAGVLKSALTKNELCDILGKERARNWNIFVGRSVSKSLVINHIGRYIRKPPIAQNRLTLISEKEVQYLAKDTRKNCQTPVFHNNREFVALLIPHVMDRYQNSMRYFGLLAPRSRILLSTVFAILKQARPPRPTRRSFDSSLYETFGENPLVGQDGQLMRWVGRVEPIAAA